MAKGKRIVPRKAIMRFAEIMEIKLRKHDNVRGDSWKKTSFEQLLGGLRVELLELEAAVNNMPCGNLGIIEEAADVANFAMFIADSCLDMGDPVVARDETAKHNKPIQKIDRIISGSCSNKTVEVTGDEFEALSKVSGFRILNSHFGPYGNGECAIRIGDGPVQKLQVIPAVKGRGPNDQ